MGARKVSSKGMAEGPCLLIEWFDDSSNRGTLFSRYFPEDDVSMTDGALYCYEWFTSRRATIVGMKWAWGEIPKGIRRRKVDL